MPSKHAKYSPSSAHRWVFCPASIKYASALPETSSKYADAGTWEHKLAERCLKKRIRPKHFIGKKFKGQKVTKEITDKITAYFDCVESLSSDFKEEIQIEKRLRLCKDVWGTVDCLIKLPYGFAIVDYKSGFVPVEPKNNLQLIIYALAARKKTPVEDLARLVIVQPQDSPLVKMHNMTHEDLNRYERVIKAALRADPDEMFAGEWCQWCAGSAICPEHFKTLDWIPNFDLPTTPISDLIKIYEQKKTIFDYLDQVEKMLLRLANEGKDLPGLKMVEKRAFTRWAEPENRMLEILENKGFDRFDLCKLKLQTPGQLKEVIGDELFDELAIKQSSGNKIVLDTERGKAAQPIVQQFMDDEE